MIVIFRAIHIIGNLCPVIVFARGLIAVRCVSYCQVRRQRCVVALEGDIELFIFAIASSVLIGNGVICSFNQYLVTVFDDNPFGLIKPHMVLFIAVIKIVLEDNIIYAVCHSASLDDDLPAYVTGIGAVIVGDLLGDDIRIANSRTLPCPVLVCFPV